MVHPTLLLTFSRMNLHATVADPLTDPPPPGWDAFVERERLPPMWRYRLLYEVDWCAQVASSMVAVGTDDGTRPVALFHVRHVGPDRPGRFARPGRVPPAGMAHCHLDSALSPGFAFRADLGTRDRAEACRVFERTLRRERGRGWLAFGYRHLAERDATVVAGRTRVRLATSPLMVLTNEWSDLAGYLATLPRKWRARLRGLRRDHDADADLRVAVGATIDPDEACWLAEVVRRRHRSYGPARPPRSPRYFRVLSALPEMRFLTYRDAGGRLVAFVGFHDDGRDLLPMWWGARGSRDGGRENLYFDQYLRLVEIMIESGRQRLVLGPGMAHIKARYGARPEARWAVVGPW